MYPALVLHSSGNAKGENLSMTSRIFRLRVFRVRAALTAIAATLLVTPCFAAVAAAETARSGRISIDYVVPKSPEFQDVYDVIRDHHGLEKLQEIFSPFRLTDDLTIRTVECGMSNAWYSPGKVTICYEYLDDIRKTLPAETTAIGIAPGDAIVGQFFYVVAHEMGHAIFDQLNVPLFGRPEDAADQFAAYLMLKLKKADARRLVGGAAYTYKELFGVAKITARATAFADAHGAPMQRLYNLMCIAYGADPELFSDVVEKGYLPKERARSCRVEYGEINFAFHQLIFPHVDKVLAEKVVAQSWLPDGPPPHRAGVRDNPEPR
jgi:hypothetical protein